MKFTLPKTATIIGGVLGVASFVTNNQATISTLPGNTPKAAIQVASGVLGLASLFMTMFGHSLGANVVTDKG